MNIKAIYNESRINQLVGAIEDIEGEMIQDTRPELSRDLEEVITNGDTSKQIFYINKLAKILDDLNEG